LLDILREYFKVFVRCHMLFINRYNDRIKPVTIFHEKNRAESFVLTLI